MSDKCTCATFKKQGTTFTMLRDPHCPLHGDALEGTDLTPIEGVTLDEGDGLHAAITQDDGLTDLEQPYDCPHREADGAWCGYPVGKAGICKQGHQS